MPADKFKKVSSVQITVTLERAEHAAEDGSIHDIHRVIVSGDGSESTHIAPNAREAVTTAMPAIADHLRTALTDG